MTLQQDIEAVEAHVRLNERVGEYWEKMPKENNWEPMTESMYFDDIRILAIDALKNNTYNEAKIGELLLDGVMEYLREQADEQDNK